MSVTHEQLQESYQELNRDLLSMAKMNMEYIKENEYLEAQNKELINILKDLLKTKEDLQTWRGEMFSTIKEVIGD